MNFDPIANIFPGHSPATLPVQEGMSTIACIVIYIFADLFRSIIGSDCFMSACVSKHSIWEVEYPIESQYNFH